MEIIARPHYIKELESWIDTDFIKVLTGVRRCGKSYLLLSLKKILLNRGVPKQNIISLNFESPNTFKYHDSMTLYEYLTTIVPKEGKVYFLFDEIQEVHEWERLINGLRVEFDSDIYVTGSNSRLLSGELATYLTGRYVEIKVYPLSFKEYLVFKNQKRTATDLMYPNYAEYGGFPGAVLQPNDQQKLTVLSGIWDSILLKDVARRGNVKDIDLLERVALFLLDNIGNSVSTKKIADYITSSGRKVSPNTIESYVSLLETSFLFYKTHRYDIRGKERLKLQAKFYVVDQGFVISELKQSGSNKGHLLENLVYLELLHHGFEVFVGKYNDKEIDFIARKHKETYYIQVTEQLPENDTRETDNLINLPTGYRKLIVTGDKRDVGFTDGIPIIHIQNFLLKDNWFE
ncbi:MAG: ATP-binding protein [Micrococcaceae bacterium]